MGGCCACIPPIIGCPGKLLINKSILGCGCGIGGVFGRLNAAGPVVDANKSGNVFPSTGVKLAVATGL